MAGVAIGGTITASSPHTFDHLVMPEQNPLVREYEASKFQHYKETLSDAGRRFMDSARQLWDQARTWDAEHLVRKALRAASGVFHLNVVTYLGNIYALRTAQPTMQRFIMAQPDIRKAYHRQLIDGYSDSYVDVQPNVIGVRHYDYRRVMDGILCDGEDGLYWDEFYDDLHTGDRDLTLMEKSDILETWELAKYYYSRGIDPTDMFSAHDEVEK
jgi:hypothetical protein